MQIESVTVAHFLDFIWKPWGTVYSIVYSFFIILLGAELHGIPPPVSIFQLIDHINNVDNVGADPDLYFLLCMK